MSSLLVQQWLWFVLSKRRICWKKKRKRNTWVRSWLMERDKKRSLYENIFQKLLLQDHEHFRKYLRMNTTTFCRWWIFIIIYKTSSFHLIVFLFSVFISISSTIIYFWWRFERFKYFECLKFFSIGLQIKSIWFDEHPWRIRNKRKNTFFPNFSKKFFIEIHV